MTDNETECPDCCGKGWNDVWNIEYDNDTGADDGGFWEWWTVTNGEKSFKSDSEDAAKWLCDLLNAQ